MDNKLSKYSLLLLALILAITGCKNPPSFSLQNERDPDSKSYTPPPPINFSVEFYDSYTKLTWQQNYNVDYTDGFKIYKSVTDTNSAIPIGTVKTAESTSYPEYIFSFTDTDGYNGVYVLYKIQSFRVQGKDTLFSSPKYYSKILNGETSSFIAHLKPFSETPQVQFKWDLNLDQKSEIQIYSSKSGRQELNELTTVPLSAEKYIAEIDVHDSFTEYYFRIRVDTLEGPLLKFKIEVQRPSFGINYIEEINKNEVAVNVGFHPTDSTGNFVIDRYILKTIQVSEATSDSIILSVVENSFQYPNTTQHITGLDIAKNYFLQVVGKRGEFETQKGQATIEFKVKDIEEIPIPTENYLRGDINLNKSADLFVKASLNEYPKVFSLKEERFIQTLNTGNLNSAPLSTGKFSDKSLFTYSNKSNVYIRDSENFSLISRIPRYPSDESNFYPFSIDFTSDEKLIVSFLDNESTNSGNAYLVLWDLISEEYNEIYSDSVVTHYWGSNLHYNETEETIHVLYNYTSQYINQNNPDSYGYLITIDTDTYEIIKRTELTNRFYNKSALGGHGKFLFLYEHGSHYFSIYDSKTHEPIVIDKKIGDNYLSSIVTAKNSEMTCFSTYSGSVWGNIKCTESPKNLESFDFEYQTGKGIVSIGLDDNGEILVGVNENYVLVNDFKKSWELE